MGKFKSDIIIRQKTKEVEIVHYSAKEDVLDYAYVENEDRSSTLDSDGRLNFGWETKRKIRDNTSSHTVYISDYQYSNSISFNDLGEEEWNVHLKYNPEADRIPIESPFLEDDAIVVYTVDERDMNIDRYKVTQSDWKLNCINPIIEEQRDISIDCDIALVEWDFGGYGRMDKVFDITNPNSQYANSVRAAGRWKAGIKYGEQCVYLIDGKNNRIYKKDVWLDSCLDAVLAPSYRYQMHFETGTGQTIAQNVIAGSGPGEYYHSPIQFTDGTGHGMRKIVPLSYMGANVTIRAGCAPYALNDSSEVTPDAAIMCTIDFGEWGEDPFQNFEIGAGPGGTSPSDSRTLKPHTGYDVMAFITFHGVENPADSKAIIGSMHKSILFPAQDFSMMILM